MILIDDIKNIKSQFNNKKINSQGTINRINYLQSIALRQHINLDNYLYKEGIFNKPSALYILKKQIDKYQKFPNKAKSYQKEYKIVQGSKQKWFENYAIHTGSHDLIKLNIDHWKVNSVLNCIISDMYIGSATEDSNDNLMKE